MMTQVNEENNVFIDTDDSEDSVGDGNLEPPKPKKRTPIPRIPLKTVLAHKDNLSDDFTGHANKIGQSIKGFCDFLQGDGHDVLRRKDYEKLTSADKAILEPEEGPQAARKKKVDLLVTELSAKATDLPSSEEVLADLSIQQSAAKRLKEIIYERYSSLRPNPRPKKKAKKQEDA